MIFIKRKKSNHNGNKIISNSFTLYPNYIKGISGENYTIALESNKRENCLKPKYIKFFNSYSLNETQLIINIEQKNNTICMYHIYLSQYKATNSNVYNILTILYGNKTLNENISLNIKNTGFDRLKWISGPNDGNVLNPPNITFIPIDKYDNIYTNLFTNETIRNLKEMGESKKKFLDSLIEGFLDDKKLEKNIYLYEGRYIKIQFKSTKTGYIKVVSPYFKEKFEYRIKSGPVDFNNTYIEILSYDILKSTKIFKLIIHPKDIYFNEVDHLDENFIEHFGYNNNKGILKYFKNQNLFLNSICLYL